MLCMVKVQKLMIDKLDVLARNNDATDELGALTRSQGIAIQQKSLALFVRGSFRSDGIRSHQLPASEAKKGWRGMLMRRLFSQPASIVARGLRPIGLLAQRPHLVDDGRRPVNGRGAVGALDGQN